MKLQRYYQRPEKSWSYIALKTLSPILLGKVMQELKYSNEDITKSNYLMTLGVSLYEMISKMTIMKCNIKDVHLGHGVMDIAHPCYTTHDVLSVMVSGLEAMYTTLITVFMLDSGNMTLNPACFGLASGAIHTLDKLFVPKVSYVDYSLPKKYYFDENWNFGCFSPYIEWIGEADKDGYCECVIMDKSGNVYNDFEITL